MRDEKDGRREQVEEEVTEWVQITIRGLGFIMSMASDRVINRV